MAIDPKTEAMLREAFARRAKYDASQPQPTMVTAGGSGPSPTQTPTPSLPPGMDDLIRYLVLGQAYREANGPRLHATPMDFDQYRASQASSMLPGLFGSTTGTTTEATAGSMDPRFLLSQPSSTGIPSPGLGSGVGSPMEYEDGSNVYPGRDSDPLLRELTEWINRRFPNGN